jgi:hypothetical protein
MDTAANSVPATALRAATLIEAKARLEAGLC